ncbi:MAG: YitT family protein, partial [Flavobacteriales bacterium]|nr:YitT family protein [Flavobacteriales bacterium]
MKALFLIKINKTTLFSELKSYGLVLFGAVVLSIGYSLFIVPHKLVPGGVFGLSIVAFEMLGMSIGVIALIINIPLLLWGTRVLGKKTVLKTAFFMITSSLFI